MKRLIPQSIKNIYHLAQAIAANVIYGWPSRKIKIIGVTGTNGKTTTCQMIARVLEEAGKKVAMVSTINFKIGEREWVNATKFTTLSAFAVQRFIYQAVKAECDYLVLETSSHSLDQNRVWGVKYKTAVITNVTREHLDYHKNMEEYRLAKLKLFDGVQTAIVNLDMEKPCDFLDAGAKIKYGFTTKSIATEKDYDCGKIEIIKAEEINLEADYSKFKTRSADIKLQLVGLFNIENALAAICVGISEGIKIEVMQKALEGIASIPGRMEAVPNSRGIKILIDYAVTPDSLEKLYSLISETKNKNNCHPERSEGSRDSSATPQNDSRVIAVFGACGERDRGKRPMMGEIVSRHADYIILTNEDPYNEDPMQIMREVASGVTNKEENENFWIIPDRREAIKKALAMAGSGDIVVVTGKGAEETMAVGNQRIPWNDRRVIQEELEKII